MSYRLTAVLVAFLVVLGGVVYYVMQQPAATDGTDKQSPPIMTFAPDDANKVTISGNGHKTELVKSSGNWTIGGAADQPADDSRVQGWIDQLSNLTADREITDVTDLDSYGLATPKMNLEIDLGGGKLARLVFGDKTPDGNDYYVQIPEDATRAKSVYLIGSYLGDDLTSALTVPPKAIPTPSPAPTLAPGDLTPPAPEATPSTVAADSTAPTPVPTPSPASLDLIPSVAPTPSVAPAELTPSAADVTPSAAEADLTPAASEPTPSEEASDPTPSEPEATPSATEAE